MPEAQNNWRRKTILFLVSQSVTLLGSQVVQMAVVWYVTLHTASGVWVAAFSVCSYLPQFFISFWGGVWADRYSRKRLIICADGGTAAVTLGMFILLPHISQSGMLLHLLLVLSVLRSIPCCKCSHPPACPQRASHAVQRHQCLHAVCRAVFRSCCGRHSACHGIPAFHTAD